MGIFIKRNHGTEYLYILVGKSQYFLGRKDDLKGLSLQNLRKATGLIDSNFDRVLAKYLKDLEEYAQYLPGDEDPKYVVSRIAELGAALSTFDRKIARAGE